MNRPEERSVPTFDGGEIPYTRQEMAALGFDGFCALVEIRAEVREKETALVSFSAIELARLARIRAPGRKSQGGKEKFLAKAGRDIAETLADKGFIRLLEAGQRDDIALELLVVTPKAAGET